MSRLQMENNSPASKGILQLKGIIAMLKRRLSTVKFATLMENEVLHKTYGMHSSKRINNY